MAIRLTWRAKSRGWLELDVLMGTFVEKLRRHELMSCVQLHEGPDMDCPDTWIEIEMDTRKSRKHKKAGGEAERPGTVTFGLLGSMCERPLLVETCSKLLSRHGCFVGAACFWCGFCLSFTIRYPPRSR